MEAIDLTSAINKKKIRRTGKFDMMKKSMEQFQLLEFKRLTEMVIKKATGELIIYRKDTLQVTEKIYGEL